MSRVLVVDDDPSGLEIRRLTLERRGHQVVVAASAPEARSAFHQAAPETVILDLRLPETEDGLALIREFRQAAAGVRIVVLSGCTADIENRPEAGMVDEILTKPVRSERLLDSIR
jgi:DNA-binding response OmpR family regulator